MPKQNRVTPFGEIIATPARGTLMGNRGILHNEEQEVIRPFQHKAWIICQLSYKNRLRNVMTPNRYTELFFLDEATALAAGHRPCFECQRPFALAFCTAWRALADDSQTKAGHIDAVLHTERLTKERLIKNRRKQTYTANINDLPDGTFISLDGHAFLLWNGRLWQWTPFGYQTPRSKPQDKPVTVLTPYSTVCALNDGYTPTIHASIS
jgi:hypothetical protein